MIDLWVDSLSELEGKVRERLRQLCHGLSHLQGGGSSFMKIEASIKAYEQVLDWIEEIRKEK